MDGDVEAVLTMSRETLTAVLADPPSIAEAMGDGSIAIAGDADARLQHHRALSSRLGSGADVPA